MPHLLRPSELLAISRMPKDQQRFEVRLYAAIVTFLFILSSAAPAMLVLFDPVKTPMHWFVSAMFWLSVALTIPHLFTLVFMPRLLSRRKPRLLAVWGATIAAFVWLFLGVHADPTQYGEDPSPWFYWLRALGCLLVAAIYAWSLNNQQLRENDRPASVD